MSNKICPHCNKRPKQKHHNSKWCKRCALARRKQPVGSLTAKQKQYVKSKIGKSPVKEIASDLGVSVSNIKRSMRGVSIWFHNGKYKNRPALVRQVLAYYSKHGKSATVTAFPGVTVKCIVDRPLYYGVKVKPRQRRWTEAEIILAAKMAGLVEAKRQAKIFNRPRAHEGSIKSLWMKRFGHGGGNIHGMSEWMAKEILSPGYPVIKTRMWSPRRQGSGLMRGLVLWCDIEKYLRRGLPKYIQDAVKSMAKFQCWLFETSDPRREILKLLRENS